MNSANFRRLRALLLARNYQTGEGELTSEQEVMDELVEIAVAASRVTELMGRGDARAWTEALEDLRELTNAFGESTDE